MVRCLRFFFFFLPPPPRTLLHSPLFSSSPAMMMIMMRMMRGRRRGRKRMRITKHMMSRMYTKTSLQQFQDVLGTQSMLLFLMNLFQPPLAFSSNQSHHFNRITPRWGGSGRGESVGGDGKWGRSPPSIIPHTTPSQPRHS